MVLVWFMTVGRFFRFFFGFCFVFFPCRSFVPYAQPLAFDFMLMFSIYLIPI